MFISSPSLSSRPQCDSLCTYWCFSLVGVDRRRKQVEWLMVCLIKGDTDIRWRLAHWQFIILLIVYLPHWQPQVKYKSSLKPVGWHLQFLAIGIFFLSKDKCSPSKFERDKGPTFINWPCKASPHYTVLVLPLSNTGPFQSTDMIKQHYQIISKIVLWIVTTK